MLFTERSKRKARLRFLGNKFKIGLSQQDVYPFHKPARRNCKCCVIVRGIDAPFQADLADLQSLS